MNLKRYTYKQPDCDYGTLNLIPDIENWDLNVLNAILDSKRIMNIITEDAKIGFRTIIKYEAIRHSAPDGYNSRVCTIKGSNDEIILEAVEKFEYIAGNEFSPPKMVNSGTKNLEEELVRKIRELDVPEKVTIGLVRMKIAKLQNITGKILEGEVKEEE